MKLTEKQEKFKKTISTAVEEALKNESFKKELIQDPVSAIKQLTGEKITLKEGAKLKVVDQTEPNTFYLNLAPQIDTDDVELSEEQLDMAAGGYTGFWTGVIYYATLGAVDIDA